MLLLGIAVTIAGFLLGLAGLGLTADPGVRLAMVLAGIAVSLTGIIRVLNGHFAAKAIWRR